MKVNQRTAIATNSILLVPYEAHHVLTYHGWMQDPDIQEATASEPMALEEEYGNQQSWRTAHDKLTFILCEPLEQILAGEDVEFLRARVGDKDDKMRGDVNFFLYPDEGSEDDAEKGSRWLMGEVDVMIAETEHRGKGLGEAAVRALLAYIQRHRETILEEYAKGDGTTEGPRLKGLMAKIKEGNAGSRALFQKLGFKQKGQVNYFGEVLMVADWEDVKGEQQWMIDVGYREIGYGGLVDELREV